IGHGAGHRPESPRHHHDEIHHAVGPPLYISAHLLGPLRARSGRRPRLEDAEDPRACLRWGSFVKIYWENDTSALKKRKVIKSDGAIDWIVLRPEFRQLLADLANSVIDGVIFYDLDRLVHQPGISKTSSTSSSTSNHRSWAPPAAT
ncbi:hypothetical protein ACWC2K_32570, partial [Streptomyces chattanoogensis]